jgi:predicted ATPase
LRQYSSLGRFELGEHGENFAAAVWVLLEEARDPRRHDSENPFSALNRLTTINAWLSELTPHPIEDILVEEAPTGEVIFALKEKPFEQPIAARSLSDGTLRFAALAFAVLGSLDRQTLAIEELENGIHPTRLALLARMLEQATADDNDLQVLASTHSPAVLDVVSQTTLDDAIVIGWDTESEASHVVQMSELPELPEIRKDNRLSALQTEGWLQFAADA